VRLQLPLSIGLRQNFNEFTFYFSKTASVHRTRNFSDSNIPQGSIATREVWWDTAENQFIANFLLSTKMKEFRKSVDI